MSENEQSRDFTNVANVVEVNILAAKAESIAGEVFNVTCSKELVLMN